MNNQVLRDPDIQWPSCIPPDHGQYVETEPNSGTYRWESSE